ncbi:MAG: amidohydrolase family protein [Acidimicrobiales bacterium]
MAATTGDLYDGLKVIDVDAHWSEPHDLWTSRAPAKYRDRVPQVKELNGKRMWYIEDIPLSRLSATSAIGPQGEKILGTQFFKLDIDEVHPGCSQVDGRLQLMDELGLFAQIQYPNIAGFGNQNFLRVEDAALRIACTQIYNDYMAQVQADSGGRILPMALIPWWEPDAVAAEVERCHAMGLRGIVTCSNPNDVGLLYLNDPVWDPMWEACQALRMPVNFHIGASAGDLNFFGSAPWKTFNGEVKLSLGSANLFLGNARGCPTCCSPACWSASRSEVRVGGVGHRLDPVPARSARLPVRGDQPHRPRQHDHAALGLLPSPVLRLLLVRVGHDPGVDRLPRRRLRDVHDRHPAPHVALPACPRTPAGADGEAHPGTRRKVLQDNAAKLYNITL